MSINIGNQKIKELYLGDTKIKEAYLGSQLIYQSTLPIYQTAIVNNGYIFTTNDNWETYTRHQDVGSRNWVKIAIS